MGFFCKCPKDNNMINFNSDLTRLLVSRTSLQETQRPIRVEPSSVATATTVTPLSSNQNLGSLSSLDSESPTFSNGLVKADVEKSLMLQLSRSAYTLSQANLVTSKMNEIIDRMQASMNQFTTAENTRINSNASLVKPQASFAPSLVGNAAVFGKVADTQVSLGVDNDQPAAESMLSKASSHPQKVVFEAVIPAPVHTSGPPQVPLVKFCPGCA